MADLFESKDQSEEEPEKGRKSLLFSLFSSWRSNKGKKKKPEKELPKQEPLSASESAPEQTPVEKPVQKAPDLPPSVTLKMLFHYRQAWRPEFSNQPESYEYFLEEGQTPDPEIQECFKAMQPQVAQRLGESVSSMANEDGSRDPIPVDASLLIRISKDRLTARCLLLPPLNGGTDLGVPQILASIKDANITYGVDEAVVSGLSQKKPYLKLLTLARGTPPQDGEDGEVHSLFSTTVGVPHLDSQAGTVDYKNLNWIVPIKAEDVICEIRLPTKGVEGHSVLGEPLRCKDGAKPAVPQGTNTYLNKEGTVLAAKVDGQIFYENGKFKVTPMIVIEGDVDLSTGNLEVTGNLRIMGNVREGFSVRATGDINVDGMVEGATLEAGRNIFVQNGMNGNIRGRMNAGGDIKCQYLENVTVRASGKIYASSIINSTVESDSEVVVLSGYGSIIGGSITAFSGIQALTVGSRMNRSTALNLQKSERFQAEKARLTEAYEAAQLEANTLRYQVQMEAKQEANAGAKATSRRPARQPNADPAAQKASQLKLALARTKEANLYKELSALTEKEDEVKKSQILVRTLYPVTQVTIGQTSRVLTEMAHNARIYWNEGEITVGSR